MVLSLLRPNIGTGSSQSFQVGDLSRHPALSSHASSQTKFPRHSFHFPPYNCEMFARLSRTTFASATRCPPKSVPLSVVRVSRRTMSATSHAPTTKSSDTPWLVSPIFAKSNIRNLNFQILSSQIGSLVFFGPAVCSLFRDGHSMSTFMVNSASLPSFSICEEKYSWGTQ